MLYLAAFVLGLGGGFAIGIIGTFIVLERDHIHIEKVNGHWTVKGQRTYWDLVEQLKKLNSKLGEMKG